MTNPLFLRHPELVSGSIVPHALVAQAGATMRLGRAGHGGSGQTEKWILKQVQDDDFVDVAGVFGGMKWRA